MQANMGNIDRVLRIIIGIALISLVFVGPQTPWGWLGIILVATALVSWCPLYRLIGINSLSKQKTS